MKRKNQTNISLLTLLPTFFLSGGGDEGLIARRENHKPPLNLM